MNNDEARLISEMSDVAIKGKFHELRVLTVIDCRRRLVAALQTMEQDGLYFEVEISKSTRSYK